MQGKFHCLDYFLSSVMCYDFNEHLMFYLLRNFHRFADSAKSTELANIFGGVCFDRTLVGLLTLLVANKVDLHFIVLTKFKYYF